MFSDEVVDKSLFQFIDGNWEIVGIEDEKPPKEEPQEEPQEEPKEFVEF